MIERMENMSVSVTELDTTPPYRQPVDALIATLATDAHRGLSGTEAQTRLKRDGRNELTAEEPAPGWRKCLAQFADVLVILLLVATAMSAALWLVERESAPPYEAIAILAVVSLNAVMGYSQKSRAEAAVAALRQMATAHANVLGDGERRIVPAANIVTGDIVLIEEGDIVPADARLIQSTSLQTAEAALTGESLPVQKDIAAVAAEAGPGDRCNKIFSGTAATYGRGKAIVTATGMHTGMGRIAGLLKAAPDETTRADNGIHHTDAVSAVQRLQRALRRAERLSPILSKPLAVGRNRSLAGAACPWASAIGCAVLRSPARCCGYVS